MLTDYLPLGHVEWHCSEEDGGPDVGVMLRLSDDKYLWAGELSRSMWEDGGPDVAALGDDFGWWIVLYEDGLNKPRVLARCADEFSMRDTFDILAAAISKGEA